MERIDRSTIRRALALGALLLLAPVSVSSGAVLGVDPRVQGGSEGGGSLPKATQPSSTSGLQTTDIATPTAGLVVDAQTRQPIAGALVVITDSIGEIVKTDVTDANGTFLVFLFDEPDLQLAIPSEGVAGLDIHAGDTVLVVVP